MKRFVSVILSAGVLLFLLPGCKNESATFSNSDGNFVLSPGGTYTQTFPQATTHEDKKDDKNKDDNSFDTLPNTGSWTLIGPSDGPGNSGFKVELDGVRRCGFRSLGDSYTIILDASSINGFDKLLGKQKAKSPSSAP